MPSRSRQRLAMFGAILVVALNTLWAYHSLRVLFNAEHWLAHTLEVLTASEQTQSAASSANNAARVFLYSGAEDFANRYAASVRAADRGVDHIAALTADNQTQVRNIAYLRERMARRLTDLDAAIATRRSHRELSEEQLRRILADSPDNGPPVRSVLEAIGNEERRLLKERSSQADTARRTVRFSFAAASLLDFLLLVLAFRQLDHTRRDREELAERAGQITLLNGELQGLNADLEQRVTQRTRELEVSNQELQAFSYSVSHDLRAPLRTIDGFSLALAEDFSDVLNDEGRDYIQRVRSGVQRMGTLIDALLQLSRVTRSDVQRETVDLSRMAAAVFAELLALEDGRAVDFSVEPGLIDEADPQLMRVVFQNLLGNALKFTSRTAKPQIQFGREKRDGKTVYLIRDNGAGFDMAYVDRLFTAFQRLHGDRDFKGSGIGLATVSRIIHRHHGTIWAEGATGVGATFRFTLNDTTGSAPNLATKDSE